MDELKLTVLNPRGNHAEQRFDDYAGDVSSAKHAPVNYHAYAACSAGSFQRDVKRAVEVGQPTLLLIRNDLRYSLKTLHRLKKSGLTVAVSLKETGYHQFHGQLGSARQLGLFRQILQLSDGVISPTEALVPIYQSLRDGHPPESCCFIPTPYPVNDVRWDFSVPPADRRGIFIGTRELKIASRSHLQSLILVRAVARGLNCPVGIINADGRRLPRVLNSIDFPMDQTDVRGKMPYTNFMRFMAQYRVVFQLDQSMVPGQVAGDCCLTRQIAAGGNGSIDRLIFPEFSNAGQSWGELLAKVKTLLVDDDNYRNALDDAAEQARNMLSFEKVAGDLRTFYRSIGQNYWS